MTFSDGASDRQQLSVRRGRHFGWWAEGRSRRGHRFMMTWWPTKGMALAVVRLWAAVTRRKGGAGAKIDVREREF